MCTQQNSSVVKWRTDLNTNDRKRRLYATFMQLTVEIPYASYCIRQKLSKHETYESRWFVRFEWRDFVKWTTVNLVEQTRQIFIQCKVLPTYLVLYDLWQLLTDEMDDGCALIWLNLTARLICTWFNLARLIQSEIYQFYFIPTDWLFR